METQKKQSIEKKEIIFLNGNRAQAVTAPPGTPASDVIQALDIQQPKALIMIIGGAASLNEALESRLLQLFNRGIARAAAKTGALIIDGGTQAGVMSLMGQGVAAQGRKSVLLGVAPSGTVTYRGGPAEGSIENSAPLDPNHSHFVLVEGKEWGGETELMFEIAKTLAKGIPVVAVLAGGGDIARKEVLISVRQGWPVIVIEQTGNFADEIARLWKRRKKKSSFIDSLEAAEIIADGNISLFPLKGSSDELANMVLYQLPVHMNRTLKLAWERFALYDANAIRLQAIFNKLQKWILSLGVLVTLLALSKIQLEKMITAGLFSADFWKKSRIVIQSLQFVLRHTPDMLMYFIIVIPITLSLLIAIANRFKVGNKWILLRAGAEAVKREVYRFRTRAENYSDQQTSELSREEKLVNEIDSISRQLMQTEVNLSALYPYKGSIPPKMYGAAASDDGFSVLSPDRYLAIRLGDQLNYYQLKMTKLDRQLKRLQVLIYILGGIGTLLAALKTELWIPLTIALVGAFATYLEFQQVENTIMKYNQAATDLANVQSWWIALPDDAKKDPKNVDKLVGSTEKILQSELSGWVQKMEDALAKLKEIQEKEQAQKEPSNQPQNAGQKSSEGQK